MEHQFNCEFYWPNVSQDELTWTENHRSQNLQPASTFYHFKKTLTNLPSKNKGKEGKACSDMKKKPSFHIWESSIVFEVIRTILSLFIIFFTKRFWAHKNTSQAKTNQPNKNKWTKNNKGNNFLCAQKLLRGWKLFVLCFRAVYFVQNLFVKKKTGLKLCW